MSLLSNLFGSAPKQTPLKNEVKEPIKKMFYPILKPGDWIGIKNGALFKTFIGNDQNRKVVFGYGFETPENFEFVTIHHLKEYSVEQIESEAKNNIDRLPGHWEKIDPKNPFTLMAGGHSFGAEKVMCQDFLAEGQKLLGAKEILVAIPRRTMLFALNTEAPADERDKFIGAVLGMYRSTTSKHAPITDLFLQVKDGRMTGAVSYGSRA